jgi:hypothetical protein
MRLDTSLKHVEPQYVRGGIDLDLKLGSSDAAVGGVVPSRVSIPAAADTATAQFKPSAVGKTSVTVEAPPGLHTPVSHHALLATVRTPGIAVADDVVIGENLQVAAALSLGEPAPETGVKVTLTSSDPTKLLLSSSATQIGKAAIEVQLPAGAVTTTYFVQALSRSGTVTHSASAAGYLTRTGTFSLAPSGVILSLEKYGPPDEAELFRPATAGSHRNRFIALLSETRPTPLVVYTAYLDPASRRSADITVQALRAGLSLTVDLKNTNPNVGTVESKAVIKGGTDRGMAEFKPVRVGESVISVVTPQGFTDHSNVTELLAIVQN